MPTTIDSQPINVNQGVSTVSKSIYAEPVPSPNGTNYERLFIVRKPFAEAMAFDAKLCPRMQHPKSAQKLQGAPRPNWHAPFSVLRFMTPDG
jgi:hypothetical protein